MAAPFRWAALMWLLVVCGLLAVGLCGAPAGTGPAAAYRPVTDGLRVVQPLAAAPLFSQRSPQQLPQLTVEMGQARPPPPLLAGPRPPSAVPRGQSPWPLPALLLAALGLAAGLAGGAGAARRAGAGAGAGARAWRCAAARGRRDEEFVELDLGEGSAGKAGRRRPPPKRSPVDPVVAAKLMEWKIQLAKQGLLGHGSRATLPPELQVDPLQGMPPADPIPVSQKGKAAKMARRQQPPQELDWEDAAAKGRTDFEVEEDEDQPEFVPTGRMWTMRDGKQVESRYDPNAGDGEDEDEEEDLDGFPGATGRVWSSSLDKGVVQVRGRKTVGEDGSEEEGLDGVDLLDDEEFEDFFRRATAAKGQAKQGRKQKPQPPQKQTRWEDFEEDDDEDFDDDDDDDDDGPVRWDSAKREARLRAQVEALLERTPLRDEAGNKSRKATRAVLTGPVAQGGSKGPRELRQQGRRNPNAPASNSARLHILRGSAKGKRLLSPPVYLRPMMSKVREAMFNALSSLGLFESGTGMAVPSRRIKALDVFAGSGSIGCEALSRGAELVVFVDLAPECCAVALKNGAACGFPAASAIAVQGDALQVLRAPQRFRDGQRVQAAAPFDLVTITPPYEEVSYPDLLQAVCESPLVGPDTVVVIEYPKSQRALFTPVIGDRLFGVRNRKYGRTNLATYVFLPQSADILRPAEFTG